jgi:hypothetical protein
MEVLKVQRQSIAVMFVLFALTAFAPLAYGQQNESLPVPISVKVTDPTGSGIPGACVSVVGPVRNLQFSKETDSQGRLPLVLRPGAYDINAVASAFEKTSFHLEVMRNSPPSVQIKMPILGGGSVMVTSGDPTPPALYCTSCRCYAP